MTPTRPPTRRSQGLSLTQWFGRAAAPPLRPPENAPPRGGSWARFSIGFAAIYAGALRFLLILLMTTHCLVLFVFALRSIELGWHFALNESLPNGQSAVIATVLFSLALVFALRFCSVMAALITSRNDAADDVAEGTKLEPHQHVALFQHVAEVARRVGGPVPHEIWVSEAAHCFTLEQRNFGISTHRILVLVLGLPHLLILRADELAVLVGHELAHFRQQDTTLALFYFRFSHALRMSLAAAIKNPLNWINPAIWIEWVSYRLFSLLIAPVQRGQEIAADCRSAEVFGGDVARRTLLREWFVASRFEALVDRRLEDSNLGKDHDPRSIYEQFCEEWQEVSAGAQQFLRERLTHLEQESYWDSHPTLKRRLEIVSDYPNFGTDPSGPASELLGSIPKLLATLGHRIPAEAETDTVRILR